MNTFTRKTNIKVGNDESVSRFNWTQDVVDSALEQIKNLIEQDKMFVELDSAKDVGPVVNLDRVAAKITDAYMSDGQIIVKAHALAVPLGNIFDTLMEEIGESQGIDIKVLGKVGEKTNTVTSIKVLGAYLSGLQSDHDIDRNIVV